MSQKLESLPYLNSMVYFLEYPTLPYNKYISSTNLLLLAIRKLEKEL